MILQNMRTGPKPLSMHLSLAAIKQLQQGAQNDMNEKQFQRFIEGVKKYQLHTYKPEHHPRKTIWKEGTISLQHHAHMKPHDDAPIVLLIPSLINGSQILDLMKKRSFLHNLSEQQITPYLLDWGDIAKDPGQKDLDAVILKRLVPAIEFLAKEHARPIHVLGYCLGGVLLMGAAIHSNECIASLTFLATPWDFHAGEAHLTNRVKFWAQKSPVTMQAGEVLPADWTHTVLASLHPEIILHKFASFVEMKPGSPEENLFIAVEDWLNDGVDLPGVFAQQSIDKFFIQNQTAKEEWRINNKIVQPKNIQSPTLIIASKKDKLIEFESAQDLHKKIPYSKIITPNCGHIGMMAGRDAPEQVWKKFADWIHDNS